MADPQVIQCAAECVVTVVHEIRIPPFTLSIEEGAAIAGAITAVWAAAYVFRMVAQFIYSRWHSTSESE
ncbi:hypothetical protein [[Acidovorax] ebreus]|uniref:Uncharacterized protein n=1 Tax=Acidovorax ebreus (strain TPSY) TaxID=535289 RepID=A0A9J9Q591_ACIET|nr:hypothetical protein [[Acidovorax] ebreus]ACM32318.1 hypothetical protein Dtpsy_0840 [[Acidovorax] ebreus TPSY]